MPDSHICILPLITESANYRTQSHQDFETVRKSPQVTETSETAKYTLLAHKRGYLHKRYWNDEIPYLIWQSFNTFPFFKNSLCIAQTPNNKRFMHEASAKQRHISDHRSLLNYNTNYGRLATRPKTEKRRKLDERILKSFRN
jgi:hypothetical protein